MKTKIRSTLFVMALVLALAGYLQISPYAGQHREDKYVTLTADWNHARLTRLYVLINGHRVEITEYDRGLGGNSSFAAPLRPGSQYAIVADFSHYMDNVKGAHATVDITYDGKSLAGDCPKTITHATIVTCTGWL